MTNIRPVLEAEGLVVEPTNYGRFGLFRFLVPLPAFRRAAMERVWVDIQRAVDLHPGRPVSFIAHSFGTLVVSAILKEEFRFRAHRVIFCGSIVPYDYPFQQISERFSSPVVNEVGDRDYWPALAESVTWGYGSTGTHSFNRPGVRDRFHKGADHSYFLEASFCRKYWVQYLKHGVVEPGNGDGAAARVPWWIELISIVRIRFLAMVLAGLLLLCIWCAPGVTKLQITAPAFLNVYLDKIARQANDSNCFAPCDWIGCSRCGRTINVEPRVRDLAICTKQPVEIAYRDPFKGARQLADVAAPCLQLVEIGSDRLDIAINKDSGPLTTVTGARGGSRLVCNPTPDCLSRVNAALE